MEDDAKELDANIVGFNFRGVFSSKGKATSKQDLVTDCIAQVQRLLDKGVSAPNITLKGHSIGAAIASLVAEHFHKLGLKINVFNGRSFSSITNFLVGKIRAGNSHYVTITRIILGWLAYPFIKLALTLVKWEINAGNALKNIPKEYRKHIVVKSAGQGNPYTDSVIPDYASIHRALNGKNQSQSEMGAIEHIYVNDNHNKPLDKLYNGSQTGVAFFRAFVITSSESHGVRLDKH